MKIAMFTVSAEMEKQRGMKEEFHGQPSRKIVATGKEMKGMQLHRDRKACR